MNKKVITISQSFSFGCSIHIRSQHPLLSRFRLVDQTQRNLENFHLKPGSKLIKSDSLISFFLIAMMPKGDQIVVVGEGDHSLRVHFRDGEDVFQDVCDTFAQLCREIVEDQVRIGLGHVRDLVLHVVSEHDILESEVDCGSDWKMTEHQTIRHTPMLMKHDQIGQILTETKLNKVLHHIRTSIDPLSIRNYNSHLLQKLHKPIRRISGCCYQDLRVRIDHIGILIVNVGPRDKGVDIIRLKLLLKFLFLAEEFGGEPTVCLLSLQDFLLLQAFLFQLGLSLQGEEVLSALTDVLAQHLFDCCYYYYYILIQLELRLDWHYKVYLVGKPVQHFETEIQQLQRNFQQYPRIKMQSFKGFLPKALCSDQAINVLTKRSEEFKKMTHQSSEIASSILKVYETYLLQLPRIMGLLFNDAQVEGQNFYSSLRTVYLEIYKEYQNFTLDHVQTPTNEITNMNSAKYIHLSGCILAFQKIIKSYSSSEAAACEMAKKYFKSQKNLMSSIQAYKESFTEAKLVYNIDQKIKRYSTCQQYYKNVALDHAMVVDMKDKLQERKKEVVEAFESLIKEDRVCENEIEVKMFTFLSKFNANACDNLKKRLFLSKEGRKKIEKVKIPNFFESFNFQDEQAEDHGGRGRRNAGNLSSLHKGGEHQNLNQIKKLYAKLERFIETRKNQHLKVFDFHLEFYKTAEKKSVSQLKQSFVNLQKNMKKIKEQFSKPTYQELKNTLAFIKQTMDIYIEVQKKIWLKIQLAGQLIEEIKTILRSLTQEVLSMIEKLSIETKDKQSADGHEFKEKMSTISEMIKFNDMKLCPIFANLKQIYSEILNIYELGLNDCHDRCHQLGKTSEGAFEESLSAIKQAKVEKLKNTSLSDLSNPDHKGQIVFEDEIERNSDFKKLKKPVEIEILEKQKQKVCPEKQQAQKQQCIGDGQEIGPPSKKAKKHKEFIQSKVNFVEGEQFKSAFSCALADKIILQGRLYVTNFRLCFFSNFNPSNVFFGQTFIQIPKKDIITLEKRKNGIFFDNSISITTIKGQVFLTSFFKRNEAYSLICETIGINKEDQAYENPGAIQSDQSELIDKAKGQKNGQADPKIEDIEAEDDIKQSEITERAEAIQKMMDELTYNFKQSASAEFVFPGLTAYKLLKVLILDGEITIGGKKYANVNEYFKKVLQSHKDIEVSSFTPPIKQYLNPCNIKSTCPLKLCRKMSANVPTPPSNIPFLPKQTKASQKQSLYIISKHKWVLDNEVQSSGAPYTDSFRVYYRTVCDSTPQACKITTKMFIHFIKNVMVKSVIESKTQEESALQFKKQYDELRKYFVNQEKSRKKREKVRAEGEALGVEKGEVQGKGDEEGDRVGELEEMLNQAKQKSQLTIKQLRGQVSRYQKMLIAALALNLVFALALLF